MKKADAAIEALDKALEALKKVGNLPQECTEEEGSRGADSSSQERESEKHQVQTTLPQ